MTTTQMPDFKTEPERQAWIIEHADYFTIVRRTARRYERIECESLAEAEQAAQRMVARNPELRLLIYAVYGAHDTYVKTVQAHAKAR